jgi:hypothetical protein
MSKPSASWDDFVREELADFDECQGYLEVSWEEAEQDGYYRAFGLALWRVGDAQGLLKPHETQEFIMNLVAPDGKFAVGPTTELLNRFGIRIDLARASA